MKKLVTLLFTATCIFATAQNALNFDGTNDYVQTTFGGVTGTADRTFEAWIYLSSTPSGNQAILDYGTNLVGSRNTFLINANLQLAYIAGGVNTNFSSSTNAVPTNQWVHVAMVMSSGTGYLYVNGTQVGTGSLSGVNTPSGAGDMRIGQRVSGGSIPFDGVIDEVRIWNVARTATEIQADMNNEYCNIPTGLVAYYKFNSGTASGTNTTVTTAIDEVSANNGTLTNFALSGSSSNWVTGASISSGSGTPGSASITSCGPYTANNGDVWATSGNYTDTITGPTGCDSIVNIALTVKPNSTNTISASGCNSYTGPSGNHTWTQSGTVHDTLPAANGCDSILTINLTINVVDTAVLANGAYLTAYANGAAYQWLDCDNGFAPISGATNQTYQATANGNYAVEINDNGCIDTSRCYEVDNISIAENSFENSVSVYPNPAKDVLRIAVAEVNASAKVSIVNMLGKVVATKTQNTGRTIEMPINLPNGVYFVKVEVNGHTAVKKITIL